MEEHPSLAEIEGFTAGRLDGPTRRAVVRHLLHGCRACCEAMGRLAGLLAVPRDASADTAYDAAIAGAFSLARRARRQADEVESRKAEVLRLVEADGIQVILELPRRLQGLPAFAACMDLSWAARHEDPQRMVVLAEIGAAIAARLPAEGRGSERAPELRCRAKIELANAYRTASRLAEAEEAICEARELLAGLAGEPLLQARLFAVEGNVLGDRRLFEEAFGALNRAERIYRRYQQTRLVSRLQVQKGLYAEYAGEPARGIKILQKALAEIDVERDPDLALAVVHNVARAMLECGRLRSARTLLWKYQHLYSTHAKRVDLLKLLWLQGRLASGFDQHDRAQEALEHVRSGFLADGNAFEAALATLDIAAILIRRHQYADARDRALEAARVFQGLSIGQEAASAVRLLRVSIELGTFEFVDQVANFLRRLQLDPKLAFHAHSR